MEKHTVKLSVFILLISAMGLVIKTNAQSDELSYMELQKNFEPSHYSIPEKALHPGPTKSGLVGPVQLKIAE